MSSGVAGGGHQHSVDDGDGEGEEESSSSLSQQVNQEHHNDELEEFRQQWKQEVSGQNSAVNKGQDDASASSQAEPPSEVEDRALALFLSGVEDEEKGLLYEAIVKYKKAIHLDKDIEKKAYAVTSKKAKARQAEAEAAASAAVAANQNKSSHQPGSSEDFHEEDLINAFASMTLQRNFVCQPEKEDEVKSAHISSLPMEVLIYILKWVVSSDLDVRSLENFSEVCRGFYVASRSSDIWRLICLRTWNVKVLPLSLKKKVHNNDWRSFFLKRPRVHLSGCYISKMTYMREGERSFTDHEFCRAWHVVTYYRLIRFLPGGLVVMNTTADSPQEAVKVMGLNMAHGYVGQYKTVDNRVICVVKKIDPPAPIQDLNQPTYKRKKKKNERPYVFEVPEMVLHFELQIEGKKFKQMHWVNYATTSKYKSSGREQTTEFDVRNENNFPSLHFSVVRSYNPFMMPSCAPLEA